MCTRQRILGLKEVNTLQQQQGAVVVDCREAAEYNKRHIDKSVNICPRQVSTALIYPKTTKFVVIGSDKDTQYFAKYLCQFGFNEIFLGNEEVMGSSHY